jgi:signal transduction histidine kinase
MPVWPVLTWQSLVHRARSDTDFAQSIVRLILGFSALGLTYWYFDIGEARPEQKSQVIIAALIWCSVAPLISLSCLKWPGSFWYRRSLGLLADYSSLPFLMIIGGPKGVALLAFLLWITIGYGLRFGRRYLALAMGCALTSAVVVIIFTPYWQTNPSLSIMMILCLLIVPLYPFALLQRTSLAEQAARAANADKSRYLAQASHDLRQPIHAIGLLAAQLSEAGDSADARGIAARISHAVHNSAEIVQTFLDVAVIESGTLVTRPEQVSIAALFMDLEHQLAQSADWAKTELRFVATSQSVLTDRSFLKAMLQNLISNAIKYAPGSKVLIGCRRQRGAVSLYVLDAGRGISPGQLARIKEPFYRAPDANQGSTHGTGLGLAIVQRLAELSDVQFDISSIPSRGTTAVLAGLQPVATAPESPRPYLPAHISQLSGTRILLIEDDVETCLATDALLKRWGCDVHAAAVPPEDPGPCDIIVSDFQFADGRTLGDHKTLLGAIRQVAVPLVMISGSDADEIRSALKPLSPLILSKPVAPAELRSVLMSAKMALR